MRPSPIVPPGDDPQIEQTIDLLRESFRVDPFREARNIDELLTVVLSQTTSELLEGACWRPSVMDFLTTSDVPAFGTEQLGHLAGQLSGP